VINVTWLAALGRTFCALQGSGPFRDRYLVLLGNDQWAVKNPLIIRDHEGWWMWVCRHPLARWGQEDRMITRYASSVDGLDLA